MTPTVPRKPSLTQSGRLRARDAPSASSRAVRISVARPSLKARTRAREQAEATACHHPSSAPHDCDDTVPDVGISKARRTGSDVFNFKQMEQRRRSAELERALRIEGMTADEREAMKYLPQALAANYREGNAMHEDVYYGDIVADEMDEDMQDGEEIEWESEDDNEADALQHAWQKCYGKKPAWSHHGDHLLKSWNEWMRLLPDLTTSYLRWQHSDQPTDTQPNSQMDVDPSDAADEAHEELGSYRIKLIGWKDIAIRTFRYRDDATLLCALLAQGYLPCSPFRPTIAISLHVLEVYHHARLRAYVSHESWARILCDFHAMPYRRYLRQQVTNAYDVYVSILGHLDDVVKNGFGHGGPNWRLLNSCSACEYRLEGEPELPHSKLTSGDGNNSSKRYATAGLRDTRVFKSDYILSEEYVDTFKDEVRPRLKKKSTAAKKLATAVSEEDTENGPSDEPAHDTEPADKEAWKHICVDKWGTSNATEDKSDVLDARGTYQQCCRHAFMLWSADMIQSGELAKYPLASLNKALEVFGAGQACGYDINCSSSVTVLRSSIGARAKELGLSFYVGAFHGYAHKRRCQLNHHPRFLWKAGLEDFETNEWIFSQQNGIARLFRHGSKFHRHMTLHWFWKRWDKDRRAALADFLHKNYKQALSIIRQTVPKIKAVESSHGISPSDWQGFIDEEREYFNNLRTEPEEDKTAFQYLETLKELDDEKSKLDKLRDKGGGRPRRGEERAFQAALRSVNRLEQLAAHFEEVLDTDPWTATCAQWRQTEAEVDSRDYNLALDRLEMLVVSRLFELEKLNLRGTNYAMRTAIAKALKDRSGAIRTALKKYNTLAENTVPPRPTLTWKTVVNYSFLNDFALLRYSRDDIRTRRWSDPTIRETTVQWLLVRCAREEIKRLNVEVRRLWTALHDEPRTMLAAIKTREASSCSLDDQLVIAEMSTVLEQRLRIDTELKARVKDIFALPGFSGVRKAGVRIGTSQQQEDITEGDSSEGGGADDVPNSDTEFTADADTMGDGDGGIDDEERLQFDTLAEAINGIRD